MESETRTAPQSQNKTRGGQFRIYFTGFRAKPAEPPAVPAGPSAWNATEAEDERAYFQADISWLQLAENDSPRTSVLTSMITGDVRGLRKRPAADPSPSHGESEWPPLSLGTYALVSGYSAISIGNFAIRQADSLRKADRGGRSKAIFLTYQSANALSKLDQGFGRGVFPIECGGDGGPAYTLYFGIDPL